MRHRILRTVLFAAAFAPLCAHAESLSLEDVAALGKKTTDRFHHTLRSELLKHQAEGILPMAHFCIDSAQTITDTFNKKLENGIRIKRISLKSRNDNDRAGKDEITILTALEILSKANAYLPEHIIQIDDRGNYKYYRPITLSERSCIACHGQPENMPPELQSLFRSSYPNDKAMCYNRGDFRGAMVVEIPQKQPSPEIKITTKDSL